MTKEIIIPREEFKDYMTRQRAGELRLESLETKGEGYKLRVRFNDAAAGAAAPGVEIITCMECSAEHLATVPCAICAKFEEIKAKARALRGADHGWSPRPAANLPYKD